MISFCQANKITNVDLDLFFSYYSEQNWMIDGKPIKNWKALLIRWATSSGGTWSKEKDVKYMENDYDFSPEAIRAKEYTDLDALLAEED